MTTPSRALRAAAFLTQALELDLDPSAIADDLVVVNEDSGVTTYAAELEASFGSAAFLVYVYDLLFVAGSPGVRSRYEADIDTLKTAAVRDAPGPRLLANGESDGEAFLLATTPATYRMLTGEASIGEDERTAALPEGADTSQLRRETASELLTHLRAANRAAGIWLAALQAGGPDGAAGADDDDDSVEFNEEETELALYLLDDRSIQNVLRAINLFITAARGAGDGADA